MPLALFATPTLSGCCYVFPLRKLGGLLVLLPTC